MLTVRGGLIVTGTTISLSSTPMVTSILACTIRTSRDVDLGGHILQAPERILGIAERQKPRRATQAPRGGQLRLVDAHFPQSDMRDLPRGIEVEPESRTAPLKRCEGVKLLLRRGLENVAVSQNMHAEEFHQLLGVGCGFRANGNRTPSLIVLDG